MLLLGTGKEEGRSYGLANCALPAAAAVCVDGSVALRIRLVFAAGTAGVVCIVGVGSGVGRAEEYTLKRLGTPSGGPYRGFPGLGVPGLTTPCCPSEAVDRFRAECLGSPFCLGSAVDEVGLETFRVEYSMHLGA